MIVNGISLLVLSNSPKPKDISLDSRKLWHFSVFLDIFSTINQFIYNPEILIVLKKSHSQAYSIQNSLLLIQCMTQLVSYHTNQTDISEQPFGSINHVVVHLPARFRHSNSGSPFRNAPPQSEQLNPSYGFHPVCLIGPIIHFQYKLFSHMTFVSIISLLSDGSALLFHYGLGSRGGLWVTWSNSIMMTDASSPGSTPPALLPSFIPLFIHFMVGVGGV